MGQEVGKVEKIESQWMIIRLSTGEHCQVCAAKSACFFQGSDAAYRYLKIPLVEGIKEGDLVTLEYRESSRILSAFIVFVLPILFILAGYLVANIYFQAPTAGIWGAAAGFAVSGVVIYLLNRWLATSRWMLPRIIGLSTSETLHPGSQLFSGFRHNHNNH